MTEQGKVVAAALKATKPEFTGNALTDIARYKQSEFFELSGFFDEIDKTKKSEITNNSVIVKTQKQSGKTKTIVHTKDLDAAGSSGMD